MFTQRAIAKQHQTFVAAKAVKPIPHPGGLVHDSLIQCSLDPKVLEIGYVDQAGKASATVDLGVVTVLRRDGAYWLDLVPARRLRSLEEHDRFDGALRDLGLRPLTMTGEDVMREPLFSNARAVWVYRRFKAGLEMKIGIMRVLADMVDVSLQELCTTVPGPQSPILAVMSLACANNLELDLESCPLGPSTRVRWRD